MNKTCLITSKYSNFEKNGADIFFIEDYIQFGNVIEAKNLCEKIYLENISFIQEYDYDGYKVTWSWYDHIHQISLKYTEIKDLIEKLESFNYDVIKIFEISSTYKKILSHYFFNKEVYLLQGKTKQNRIKLFVNNLILLIFTMISIVNFSLRKKKYVGIRTEDMVYKNTKSDFRLNNLYEKLEYVKTDYIEFIRSKSIKDFFKNTVKRKRFSIYYDSIVYFVKMFTKKITYKKKPSSFYESILFETVNDNIILIKSIKYAKEQKASNSC